MCYWGEMTISHPVIIRVVCEHWLTQGWILFNTVAHSQRATKSKSRCWWSCWQWDPNQLSALAEKLQAQDVHVYMSSIGISCKNVIINNLFLLVFFKLFFFLARFCTNPCITCLDITKQIKPTEKSTNKKKFSCISYVPLSLIAFVSYHL